MSLLLYKKSIVLPKSVGVYLFSKNNTVLYVGKSNNIRSRVLSYFKSKKKRHSLLINTADDISFFLIETEKDALFLENNLIKKHKPKYNILLKDDKSFPWLCIKNERFPRVFITRKRTNNSDFYFGPYVSKKHLNNLFNVIKKNYKIRTCNYNLSEKNILSNKYNLCLDYYLKNCNGPCAGFEKEEDYNKNIIIIKKILSGNYSYVLNNLKKNLNYYSKKLSFEKCEIIKNQINSINYLKYKSVIISEKKISIDCFYILCLKNYYYVNFTRVVEGSVIYLKNYKILNNNFLDDVFVLNFFLKNLIINYKIIPKNIISNISGFSFFNKNIINPKKGYKKRILDFSFNTLLKYIDVKNDYLKLLSDLKSKLFLKNIPINIHCFDVSTLGGKNTTASCVVFKKGKPYKNEYKSFLIKKTVGIDDYKSISEAVERKYNNAKFFPDLIIIDGGIGQLNSGLKVLKKLKLLNIDIISIAKKEELIYLKNKKIIKLNNKDKSLNLIKFLRDEAHRFCLKKHIINRNKNFINSELNNIKGIGYNSIKKLFKNYKSINEIKNLKKIDFINTIGIKKGIILYEHFNKKNVNI